MMNHDPPVLARSGIEFLGAEHTLEYEQRCAHAGCAQCGSLVTERDREAIGLDGQGVCATLGAMSVGVGLQHREHPPAMDPAQQPVVVAQCSDVDLDARRPAHRQPQTALAARRGCRSAARR